MAVVPWNNAPRQERGWTCPGCALGAGASGSGLPKEGGPDQCGGASLCHSKIHHHIKLQRLIQMTLNQWSATICHVCLWAPAAHVIPSHASVWRGGIVEPGRAGARRVPPGWPALGHCHWWTVLGVGPPEAGRCTCAYPGFHGHMMALRTFCAPNHVHMHAYICAFEHASVVHVLTSKETRGCSFCSQQLCSATNRICREPVAYRSPQKTLSVTPLIK